ncbi:hypothetical protein Pelo_19286 [Pelomyxa schiedti]|nr:hypothetical protein Pelo_19286 [Pelomyxa schiedti]
MVTDYQPPTVGFEWYAMDLLLRSHNFSYATTPKTLQAHCGFFPRQLIVCGNKADLSKREVTREEGQHIAQSIGADVWIETSAKTGHNIDKLFFLATLHALQSAHDSLLIPQNNNPAPTPINSNFRVDVSIIQMYSLWQFHFV